LHRYEGRLCPSNNNAGKKKEDGNDTLIETASHEYSMYWGLLPKRKNSYFIDVESVKAYLNSYELRIMSLPAGRQVMS